MRSLCLILCVAVACAVFVFPSHVSAQDALGSGNALDNNLGTTSGRINAPAQSENFRARNLVITGNVAGGRGFRESVGYTATLDFRDDLGSNELFEFRAGSAYSSPELIRSGRTFDQFRFGQALGLIEYQRAGSGSSLGEVTSAPVSESRWRIVGERLDRGSLITSSISSETQNAEPVIIGSTEDRDGRTLLMQASTVRGLTIVPVAYDFSHMGLTAFDTIRLRDDIDSGRTVEKLGKPFETKFAPQETQSTIPESHSEVIKMTSSIQPDYENILIRIAQRFTDRDDVNVVVSEGMLNQLDETYANLRQTLFGMRKTGRDTSMPSPTEMTQPPVRKESPREPDKLFPGKDSDSDAGTSLLPGLLESNNDEKKDLPLSVSEYGRILRHGERVQTLTINEETRFNELMKSAEEKLAMGDYFFAERHFDRALRFQPGNPLATVGLAHSQLGAGLYLSASLTMRNLFTVHPEMIDTTYSERLLPSNDRMKEAIETLKDRLDEPEHRSDHAFLLAYVGRQMNNRQLIEKGLRVLTRQEPNEMLPELLHSIWLESDVPTEPSK